MVWNEYNTSNQDQEVCLVDENIDASHLEIFRLFRSETSTLAISINGGDSQAVSSSTQNIISASGSSGCPNDNSEIKYIQWKWSQIFDDKDQKYSTHELKFLKNQTNYNLIIEKNILKDNQLYGIKLEARLLNDPNSVVQKIISLKSLIFPKVEAISLITHYVEKPLIFSFSTNKLISFPGIKNFTNIPNRFNFIWECFHQSNINIENLQPLTSDNSQLCDGKIQVCFKNCEHKVCFFKFFCVQGSNIPEFPLETNLFVPLSFPANSLTSNDRYQFVLSVMDGTKQQQTISSKVDVIVTSKKGLKVSKMTKTLFLSTCSFRSHSRRSLLNGIHAHKQRFVLISPNQKIPLLSNYQIYKII